MRLKLEPYQPSTTLSSILCDRSLHSLTRRRARQMKPKLTSIIVSLALIGTMVVSAQQSGLSISQLRTEIQKRETLDIPEDLRETNNRRLRDLRAELHTLLEQEIRKLVDYKNNLSLEPGEAKKVEDTIQTYKAELVKLEALQPGPMLATTAPTSLPASTFVAPTVNPTSAPPARSPAAIPTPTPAPVSASAGTNTQTTQKSCADLDALSDKNAKAVSQVDYKLCDLANAIKQRANRQVKLTGAGAPDYFDLLVILIAKRSTPTFLLEAEEARVDKQVGSTPASSGSTSLVVKGGAPAILGFATENGALTQSTSGTTVTFRGNPLGIFHALHNDGLVSSFIEDENDLMTRLLRKTSFAFSFDTDRGPQPGVFTASKQQLSSVSARFEFINKRRPSLYTKEWNDFLQKQAQQFTDTINNSVSVLIANTESTVNPLEWRDPVLQTWYAETQTLLAAATTDQVESVLRSQIDKLPVTELSPQTVTQLNGIENSIGVYLQGRDSVLDKIAKGTLVTLDFTNKREANAPDTSNFTFIAEKGPGGRTDFTFNGSLTFFNKKPTLLPGSTAKPVGRIREFSFSGQFDIPFGSVREAGQFVLWGSGKYQRLMEVFFTQACTMVPNTKGDIAVGQFGLRIPIKGLGIKFPISVSFANRTELIKEKTVRANFGFTFDLDTIFAKFKPF